MKYKNRVRSRIANLKDAKNPNLRKNVLCGNIPPDKFAKMTAEVSKVLNYFLIRLTPGLCSLAIKTIYGSCPHFWKPVDCLWLAQSELQGCVRAEGTREMSVSGS